MPHRREQVIEATNRGDSKIWINAIWINAGHGSIVVPNQPGSSTEHQTTSHH
jgi:hypothetical protein